MTKVEKKTYTKAAQDIGKKCGYKFIQKDMVLLEGGSHVEKLFPDLQITVINYVMFEDTKTGKEYQCYSNPYGYDVKEYIA